MIAPRPAKGALLLLLLVIAGLPGCLTTTVDRAALQASHITTIAVVIGSDIRGRLAVVGPILGEAHAPLTAELERRINGLALDRVRSVLARKGYVPQHLKTVPIQWDAVADISDSRASYESLLRQYEIPPTLDAFDAMLFVELLIQPRTWGAAEIERLTLDRFKTMYAKSKIFLYDHHTGRRLFFSSLQRGYDQVLTNVGPAQALGTVLSLDDLPHASR